MSYDLTSNSRRLPAGRLREVLQFPGPSYGCWCMIPNAFGAEIASASGCDWVAIDQQHGLVDAASTRAMIQAAAIRDTPVIVRVPWNDPAAIMRALDDGAEGVIIPMVNSAAEAEAAVGAARYPPHGFRSWGPLRSTLAQPGFNPATGNDQIICLVMIETVEAVNQLESILDVPGVDGVLVGPNDLAISHSGTTADSPLDASMIASVVAACRERQLIASIGTGGLEDILRRREAGFTMIGLSSDVSLIASGLAHELEVLTVGANQEADA
jgi:4-hydroxy-2-oxoheptanedioate aldolase